jgi:hypothetical protein
MARSPRTAESAASEGPLPAPTGQAPTEDPSERAATLSLDRRKRRAASNRRLPNPESLELAEHLATSRSANCPIRKSFARRTDAGQSRPWLARLVGADSGRAAEPRIKIVLTLLFLAKDDQRSVSSVQAAKWALLLGLDDPDTQGARRVSSAVRWLSDEGFIDAERGQGRAPRLRVRHESGDGPWTSPVGRSGERQAESDRYFQLDHGFWANGWITVLSARAVAALLVVLDATWALEGTRYAPKRSTTGRAFSETIALPWKHITEQSLVDNYAISRDLFDRGVKELVGWGILETRKRSKSKRTEWDDSHLFREVRVRLEVLQCPVARIAAGEQIPPRREPGLANSLGVRPGSLKHWA